MSGDAPAGLYGADEYSVEPRRRRKRRRPQGGPRYARQRMPAWLSFLLTTLAAVAVGWWILATRGYVVPSESMEPTLLVGDQFSAEVMSAPKRGPRRGEIWVLDNPQADPEEPTLVKRVIGLPGEMIEVRDGQVWVNGQPLREPYLKEAPAYVVPPFKVPERQYWVLGDNRNESEDSHIWKRAVPREGFVGRAFLRYAPIYRLGAL